MCSTEKKWRVQSITVHKHTTNLLTIHLPLQFVDGFLNARLIMGDFEKFLAKTKKGGIKVKDCVPCITIWITITVKKGDREVARDVPEFRRP